MLRQAVGAVIVLLCAGCSTSSPYQNVPPECQDSPLANATGGILGRTNMAACRAAIKRQGGPMSIMKSPEQLQQEFGARRPTSQQQDMQPMTPEQYQQTQQMMQQMQPMMRQMQGGMMPQGQMPMRPPTTGQQGQQPIPSSMPQMTPQQQEQMRLQMQQQMQQQQQMPQPVQ